MSQKGMKLTHILQQHNQYPQSDVKYQPLRRNIQQGQQNAVQSKIADIQGVSYVSRRLKSLSPDQTELIKNITYIPVNCHLQVSQSQQRYQRATSQRYVAINYEEKQGSKPITPNTFKQVVKNHKTEVVYEYNCPNGRIPDDYNQDLTQSKRLVSDRTNNLVKNENQGLEYSRRDNSRGDGYNLERVVRNGSTAQVVIRDSNLQGGLVSEVAGRTGVINSTEGQGVRASITSPGNIRNSTSPSNHAVKGSSTGQIRNTTSTQGMKGSQKRDSSQHNNIYTQNYVSYHEFANDDTGGTEGPTFFDQEGRSNYANMGINSRHEYQIKSKRQSHPANIQIGGRTKSSTKNTIEDFESNIGINSRHQKQQNNLNSTKDFSTRHNFTKEDQLDGQETQIKAEYVIDRTEGEENSRVRDYVQNVESRIIIGNQGKNTDRRKVEMSRQAQNPTQEKPQVSSNNRRANYDHRLENSIKNDGNTVNTANRATSESANLNRVITQPQTSPQISQRNRKVREYEKSGSKGYNFRKNEEKEGRQKKQDYKYNLYSMCDEQFNLKCATGLFTPNEICASEPKRQGWN